jgi:succinoglycan biosynthesis transport protein ExoP
MQRRPPSGIQDIVAIFLRRKWWVIVPFIAIAVGVFAVSSRLPRFYTSETLILVDPQKVPENYVKATVSSDLSDRLQTISQEILSRTRLQKIIDQFGLYRDQRGTAQEDIIAMMRKDITVEVQNDGEQNPNRDHGAIAFKITYLARDPHMAQDVTRQLASLFIEENERVRAQQAEGTDEFISSELEKARVTLQQQEEKVKAFKSVHLGSLPEQEQSNLAVLGQYQGLLQANSDAISRAQQQRTYLQSMMEALKKKQLPSQKSPTEQALEQKRAELLEAQQKYTNDHPDVIGLKTQVSVLEEQVKNSSAGGAAQGDGVEFAQLRGQINTLDMEIKNRNARLAEIEGKIRSLQGRVDMLPSVEQQFADLTRDYETSKNNYQSLLEKKNSSGMAAEMERRAKGEQFRILDPATLPQRATKPDMLQINLFGVLGGLAFGCGLGFLMEMRDSSMHADRDAAYYLNVPVLGSLPLIATKESIAAERRRKWMTASACAAAMVAIAVLFRYIHMRSPELFHLSSWL